MRKMSIDFNMIRSEMENLARELNRHRDNDLSHNDKITVSDLLAETVTMIRKKYGITTMYYVISEAKAAEGIGYAEPFESRTGQWEDDFTEPGWYICSGCGGGKSMNQENFCPDCGRRMKNAWKHD